MTLRFGFPAVAVLSMVYSACGRTSHAPLATQGASSSIASADRQTSLSTPICPAFISKGDSTPHNEPLGTALLSRGHEAGATESVTVAILGPPLARRVEHDTTYADTIVRLRYAGLEVEFYKSADRELLSGLTLTSPHCEVYPGLSVGASARNLSQLFGAPTFERTVADSLILQFQAGEPGPVDSYIVFGVLQDTIRTIRWQFGID